MDRSGCELTSVDAALGELCFEEEEAVKAGSDAALTISRAATLKLGMLLRHGRGRGEVEGGGDGV